MLIYDLSDKDKVFDIVTSHLKNLGIKHRVKKSARKVESNDKHVNNSKKVFNVPLSIQPLDGVQLASGAIVYVPVFVKHTILYLEKFLNQEGLFRKAGSQARLKELVTRIDNGHGLGGKHHAIDVANCLKKYFRDLPEPIIPFTYHDLFVRCGMMRSSKVDNILMACLLLPAPHLNTLAFLMDFLRRVSEHEDQNKMSSDNLAKVIGPNIMPLRETTITAMQNRLEAHLSIVKILIENSSQIGVIPKDIMENIQAESYCSTEGDIDRLSGDRFREKKKKHRSGSLTRMFNGLKKIVGKNGSLENIPPINENRLRSSVLDTPQSSPTKICKKRKNGEIAIASINNKKKRPSLDGIIESTVLSSQSIIPSPVRDQNSQERNFTTQKSKVRKYLSHNIQANGVHTKIDKPKKLGISLDRFVSRSKQKINELEVDKDRNNSESSPIERRWSTSSGVSSKKSMKKRRLQNWSASSLISSPPRKKQTELNVQNEMDQYDKIFTDAEINLSDENGEDVNSSNHSRKSPRRHSALNKKLDSTLSYRNEESFDTDEPSEEYVKIPKSEYEEIKNRVSAIESRISQELDALHDHTVNRNVKINSLNQVQSEYEKTLGEASIESITSADHLARRLSKELKIRRSAEHKVIRSPSARRISSLRRRSQEKPITGRKRVSRMSSWHVSEQTDNIDLTPKPVTTKSGSYQDQNVNSFCSEETNARLNYLQQQLCTLINHTAEHTGSFLNDEEDVSIINIPKSTPVRRASSFHGNELIEEYSKFTDRVDKFKKINSQVSIKQKSDTPVSEIGLDKRISWKNASTYLDAVTPLRPTFNASVVQTGRASVAKLRTQNAGMVLAKAKLFDHNKGKTTPETIIEQQQRISISRDSKEAKNSIETRKKKFKSPKSNGARLKSESPSDLNGNSRQSLEKRRRQSPISDQENRQTDNSKEEITKNLNSQGRLYASAKTNATVRENELVNHAVEMMNVTSISNTPHIKKPLSTKTPKSARSLVRRPVVDSRRTPLKAVPTLTTPKRQSPRYGYKSRQLTRNIN
ncbi:rho GTPase-activating protein 24-like [Chelonus insularis]|uniref:rho GTPase-activating protein 24-like n=1 Tax=Chelonus insularis TaxID=460826 RepID=UPI00158B7484|nr:rho GTPase-activating protein 24-like [Chelonus insularis]